MIENYREIQSLVALFLERVDRNPDQPLLWSKSDDTWHSQSWAEVAAKAKNLACHMQEIGIEKGDRVLLLSENRPEWMIADIAIELECMRLMLWRAAALAERGEDFHEHAYLAKQFAAEHSMKIGTDGVQLLGGHGFCCEHPVELWYRNLRAISTLEGTASA